MMKQEVGSREWEVGGRGASCNRGLIPACAYDLGHARPNKPHSPPPTPHSPKTGFTLIELLVVMAVVALLLSIAAPRYFKHVETARENSLRQSLAVMRDALDKYEADLGMPANSLEDLLTRSYLRQIPEDPYTGRRDTWVLVPPPDGSSNSVFDIHSPAEGTAADGTPLGEL